MKKTSKIIAIIVAFILIGILLIITNAFVGNPISKMIVTNNANTYIKETYPDTDYYIESVNYSFKTGGYYAHIKSPSSKDTYFSVSYSLWGNKNYDNFSSYVEDKFNTWDRINSEYRTATNDILENLPYVSEINFAELETSDKGNNLLNFGLDMASLELDRNYDIKEMASKYGKVTLYVDDEDVSIQKVSEILLEVKEQFDNNNQAFYAIDLVLRNPRNKDIKDWQDETAIRLECFLYSDINDENLIPKIEVCIEETQNYYDEMDEEKFKEKP